MKILVVSNYYPPHSTGGYDIACEAFVSRLAKRGHCVSVLSSRYGVDHERATDGVERLLHRPQDSSSLLQLLWQERRDMRLLKQFLAKRPDVVLASNLLQLFPSLHTVLAKSPVPVVYFLQDPWIPAHLRSSAEFTNAWLAPACGLRGRLRRGLGRAMARLGALPRPLDLPDARIEHLVYCSNELVARARDAGFEASRSQAVIHNGVDPGLLERPPATDSATLRVLFVGRLVHEKGAHLAIDAVRLARTKGLPVRLTLAVIPSYPWDYVEEIRRVVASEQESGWLTITENVANNAIRHLYWDADVLVFPSTVREGLPMTVLEAMAASLPVVGSITGGTGEVLRDGINGLTFEPGDALGLADCLAKLARGRDLLLRLSRGARETICREFSIDKQTDALEHHLQQVVARCAEATSIEAPV